MKKSWLFGFVLLGTVACEGTPITLSAEAKESTTGASDSIDLIVKAEPGVDLTVNGKTESTGESPNHTFAIPKSTLKLGKNTFTIDASAGGAMGKRAGTATASLDVGPKQVVHFQSPTNAAPEATFTCAGTMCGATSIGFTKAGKMPLQITSDIASTITFEGKKLTLAAGGHDIVEVDLVAKLATTSVVVGEDVTFPFTIEANGEKASDSLALRGNGMIELATRELKKIEQGPVTFPGEPASTDPPDALVVIGAPTSPLIVVGKAKTFQDVDLVAVANPTEHRFPCPNGAGLLYVDMDVKIYNRRTGASVGSKTLSSDRTTCPPTPAAQVLKSVVREDDTKKVLADYLKK